MYYAGQPANGIGLSYSRSLTTLQASYGTSGIPSIAANPAYGGSGHPGDASMYAHSHAASMLEQAVKEALVEKPVRSAYVPGSAKGAYLMTHTPHEYFIADTFLKPGSTARFIGDAADVKEYVEEAFKATTGDELPKDIMIIVLDEQEFKKAHVAHNGSWHKGVQGFSLNTNGRGVNRIFVRAAPLDRLMLTIGHEIGHVLTPSLQNEHDEEAKAFAFSLAWMDSIREKNIAGIGSHIIIPEPAENGLHDIAFAFVQRIIEQGTRAWDAFLQLARGTLTIREQPVIVEV